MATYYVAQTGGNDANTPVQAQSISTPWATPTHAIPLLSPGDTLYIRTGSYTDQLFSYVITFPAGGGSYASAITISAYQSEVVTLKWVIIRGVDFASYAAMPAYYIWQNLIWSGGNPKNIEITNAGADRIAHHMKWINCEFKSSVESAVFTNVASTSTSQGSDTYFEFTNCISHNNGGVSALNHGYYLTSSFNTWDGGSSYSNSGNGIQLFPGPTSDHPRGQGNVIKNMILRDNGIASGNGSGAILTFEDGVLFYNNLCYGNQTAGLRVSYNSVNSKIYNNTCYANLGPGIQIGDATGGGLNSTGVTLRNNICLSNSTYGVRIDAFSTNADVQYTDNFGNGTNPFLDNGTTSNITNNITLNPLLTNAAASDFSLTASSPCRDAGTSTSPDVTTDYIGTARPQNSIYDIGAYEYIVTVPPTTLPVQEPFTGTGALSSDWTAMLRNAGATISRDTNQGKSDQLSHDCMAYWSSASFSSAQYSQFNIVTGLAAGTHFAELLVRASGTGSAAQCYGVVTDGTAGGSDTFFFKMLSNVVTLLASISTAAANTNSIKLSISVNHVMTFWIDSGSGYISQATYDLGSSPDILSGSAGIGLYDASASNMRIDNWEGGNVNRKYILSH